MKKATILIPDISGYTQFMTKTELSHSTHIINELLQVIADSIQSDFNLVEIEGDALLTYAEGHFDQGKLEAICGKAFSNFHYYLKVIERDRVCRCGSCQGASELSLKFIVHYGVFEEIKVSYLTKLSGPDMIIAHRLMKNDIPNDEYVLMTDAYFTNTDSGLFAYQKGSSKYDVIGDVPYHYADISFLREQVATPEELADLSKDFGLARAIHLNLAAPIEEVHRVLTDQKEKFNYVEGLVDVKMDDEINRVGSSHICEFDGESFDIRTLQNIGDRDQIIYIEKATFSRNATSMLIYYELNKSEGNSTSLSVRMLTADRQPLQGPMADQIYGQNMRGLQRLKAYVEKLQVA